MILCALDITDGKVKEENERKNAVLIKITEALQRKETEYLEILDGSTEAAWIIDIPGNHFEYSPQWLKRIGAESISADRMKSYIDSLIHPDDLDRVLSVRYECYQMRAGKFKAEYRLKTADGHYIWVMDKGKITYDESGTPFRAYGTTTDITEQKNSEAVILHQNNILQSITAIYTRAFSCETVDELGAACLNIIETLTESSCSFVGDVKDGLLCEITLHNPDGQRCALARSDKKESAFGLEIRGLYGWVLNNGRSLMTNEPSAHPCSTGTPQGHPEITAFLGVPFIQNGRVIGMLAVANRKGGYKEPDLEMLEAVAPTIFEVLIRKRTEEAVRENELLLRTIIDSSSDFLFIKDQNGKIVMVNRAYGELFRVDVDKVVGRYEHELCPDHTLTDRVTKDDRTIMRTGKTLTREESLETSFGKKVFLFSKVPWRDTGGRVLGVLGIAHDITELKKAEASLQESVASMKHSKDYIDLLYETTGTILSSPMPRQDISGLCVKVMRFLDCQIFLNYLSDFDRPELVLNACAGIDEKLQKELERLSGDKAVCAIAVNERRRFVAGHIQASEDPRLLPVKEMGIRAYACHPLIADQTVIGTLSFGTKTKDCFQDEELLLMKTVAESVCVAVNRKHNEEMLIGKRMNSEISIIIKTSF